MPTSQSDIEGELRSLQQRVTVYEELLKETRRSEEHANKSEERAQKSEDRLLSTVHWALALAAAILLVAIAAVLSLNWWINEKVYTRDKQALREELITMVKEEIATLGGHQTTALQGQFTQLETKLSSVQQKGLEQFRQGIDKDIRESFVYTLGQVADLRLFLGDVEGAVRTGLEQFDQATQGPQQHQAHALDKLIAAFRIGTQERKPISREWLAQVQKKLLERSDAQTRV